MFVCILRQRGAFRRDRRILRYNGFSLGRQLNDRAFEHHLLHL